MTIDTGYMGGTLVKRDEVRTPGYFRERVLVWVLCLLVPLKVGASGIDDASLLMALSLEELMDVEVFTAAKKEQKLFDTAAAVSVVTAEEIRRSGATTLPEILRRVPGLEVARVDANKWGLSARGFNGRFANKLQVLIDGRTLYTPLFAGVFWREHDMVLEDVARIEVIRGPGATLWGANAVNGIINIITKEARDTQGMLVAAGSGTEERGFGSVRFGGNWGERGHYRVYAKYFDRGDFVDAAGRRTADGWRSGRAGFRFDLEREAGETLSLQGQVYDGDAGQTYEVIRYVTPPFYEIYDEDSGFAGGHFLGRWEKGMYERGDVVLQVYYDRHDLDDSVMAEARNTADVDFQHHYAFGSRHELVWGLGYRFSRDDIDVSFPFEVEPERRTMHLFSAFAQDDIILVPEQVRLTLGAKCEHNEFTGLEFQPNMRLLWQPDDRQTFWGAAARAVRTPARAEVGGLFPSEILPTSSPGALNFFFALVGNPEIESEELLALELGYRVRPTEFITLDLAAFYNIYDQLLSYELQMDMAQEKDEPEPYILVPVYGDNKRYGNTRGLELELEGQMREGWRLHGTYTYLDMRLDLDSDSWDTLGDAAEGESPQHQYFLGSALDLPGNLLLDTGLRYVDELPTLGIDSYFSLDLRLGWQLGENLEIALVGQNLLDSHHREFLPEYIGTLPTETQRGVYGQVIWQR